MNSLTLYPSSWLYNAGVIGLIWILDEMGITPTFSDDGTLTLTLSEDKTEEIFRQWVELSPKAKSGNSLVYGWKSAYYANQTESSIKRRIHALCSPPMPTPGKKKEEEYSCSFCTRRVRAKKSEASFLSQAFSNILLGSETTFANMYWGNSSKDYICPQCEFIVMCHHLAFTPLSDGSEIFINAPSFRVMYYLNKFARKVIGAVKSGEGMRKREILAMSVMEYAMRIHTTLGMWTGMNIELISRRSGQIEFFSLPYEVTRLLADRSIASLLNRIGEFYILNLVLERNLSRLIELSYRLLRIGIKPEKERTKSEKDFLNKTLFVERNKHKPTKVAQEIMKLYTLIEEKTKAYGYA